MFRGRFEHAIDEKGRLAIPSRYRELLSQSSTPNTVIITNFDKCLAAYSLETWEKLEKAIGEMPQFDPNVVGFLRYFVSGASECNLDKSGRVLIPANLRDVAQLNTNCVIAGSLHKFEIWSENIWQSEFASLSDQFLGLNKAMGELGIRL